MSKIMEILDDFPDHYLLPSTFKISLVLLITFEWIKLEIPDWSHFKDLFNIFKTVTNFMSIPWKTTNLWAVKHRHFHGNFRGFFCHLFSSCFMINPHISFRSCVCGPVCWFVQWLVCLPISPSIREMVKNLRNMSYLQWK